MNNEAQKPQGIEAHATPDLLRAIRSVVLDLANILSDYREAFVLSGGLALHLLFPTQEKRIDSTQEEPESFERLTKDVDLILNVLLLEEKYDDKVPSIGELLTQNGYQLETRKHYWIKSVNLPGFTSPIEVPVEFLAPGRFADSASESAILDHMSGLQEVKPALLGGVDLALLQPRTVTLSGLTPSMQRLEHVPIQVVDLAMLILVKAIAFQDRLKKHESEPGGERHLFQAAKHAYDISECLRRYPGKMLALADRIAPFWLESSGIEQRLVDDALECLRKHFNDPTAEGIRRMIMEERYRFYAENEKITAQRQTSRRVQQLLNYLDERL